MPYKLPLHVQCGQVHGRQQLQVDDQHVDGRGLGHVGLGAVVYMALDQSCTGLSIDIYFIYFC